MKWQTVFVVPMLAPHPTPYLLSFSLFSPIGCFFHLFSRYFWCYSFQSTLLWLLYNQSKTFHCMLYKKKGSRFYHSPHYTILYTANSTLLLSPSDIHSRSDIYHVLLSCSQTEPSSGPRYQQICLCVSTNNHLHCSSKRATYTEWIGGMSDNAFLPILYYTGKNRFFFTAIWLAIFFKSSL